MRANKNSPLTLGQVLTAHARMAPLQIGVRDLDRAPVLVLSGCPPRGQSNRGALQDLPHAEIARPVTRYSRTLSEPTLVLPQLDEAVSCALGHGGEPGPVCTDIPTDTLDQSDNHGEVVGTRLQFANHAQMAAAFGMHAERVNRVDDLPGAIKRALANRPSLLDVVVSPDARSSDGKTGLAWVPDLQPLDAWNEAERQWRAGHGGG